MSALLIALIGAVGSSAWVYTKLQDRTGYGNNKPAIQGTVAVFIVGFIVLFTIFKFLLP